MEKIVSIDLNLIDRDIELLASFLVDLQMQIENFRKMPGRLLFEELSLEIKLEKNRIELEELQYMRNLLVRYRFKYSNRNPEKLYEKRYNLSHFLIGQLEISGPTRLKELTVQFMKAIDSNDYSTCFDAVANKLISLKKKKVVVELVGYNKSSTWKLISNSVNRDTTAINKLSSRDNG